MRAKSPRIFAASLPTLPALHSFPDLHSLSGGGSGGGSPAFLARLCRPSLSAIFVEKPLCHPSLSNPFVAPSRHASRFTLHASRFTLHASPLCQLSLSPFGIGGDG